MILYKFRRDSEYTEKIFTTRRVRLSTAGQLNDPFECSLQEIAIDWIGAKVKEMKQAQFAGFIFEARRSLSQGSDFFGLMAADVVQLVESLKQTSDFELAYSHYRDFITSRVGGPPSNPEDLFTGLDEQLNEVGIFSMSEIYDEQLLWSHYTEDHKGLCLGFASTEGSRLADANHCLKVNYSDSMPKMVDGFQQEISFGIDEQGRSQVSSQIALSDVAVRAAITTKPVCWSYEREWRYVEPEGGDYPWPGLLSEIVFGLKCPPERREYYMNLASQFIPNEVSFYEMRKIANSKSIERVGISPRSCSIKSPVSPVQTGRNVGDHNENEIANLIDRDQYEAALDALGTLLKNNPREARLWHLKGTALGKSGDAEGAFRMF